MSATRHWRWTPLLAALALGCGEHGEHAHEAAGDHEHGAASAAPNEHEHAHGAPADGRPADVVTHFTDATELFVEYPALVVGEESTFAAHFTRLADYRPVAAGAVTVRLSGGGKPDEEFGVAAPSEPGIFRPTVRPAHAGRRRLAVQLAAAGLEVVHDLGERPVFASLEQAIAAASETAEEHGTIAFLKEQQWKIDFRVDAIGERQLRRSVPAFATVRARSDGEAVIAAPLCGRITTAGAAAPRIGQEVAARDPLVSLAPKLSDSADQATLDLDVQRARLELERATAERERLAGLLADGAVAASRVAAAETAEATARAELAAARRRLREQRRFAQAGGSQGGVKIRAPLDGTITAVQATAGAYVEEGQELLRITDLDRLWIELRVSESNLGRLDRPAGAWLELKGIDAPLEVGGDCLVAVGGVLDPSTRTVPVVFEVPNPERRLRVGMTAPGHVVVGEPVTALAVPREALLREEGRDVVMVMVGGESFERRLVELGIRDNGWVEVKSGLAPGERVVALGAYAVKLAASASSLPAHGHAH